MKKLCIPDARLVELDPQETYSLDETLLLNHPIIIDGHGAVLRVACAVAVKIMSSDVTLKNLHLIGGAVSVRIDSAGQTIQNIVLQDCVIEDYGRSGLIVGGSLTGSVTEHVHVTGCTFHAAQNKDDKGHIASPGCDLELCAALGGESSEKDYRNCFLRGLTVDHCRILGPSVCNFMIVPGLCMSDTEMSKDIFYHGCAISDMKINDNTLMGSGDTAVAAQTNYINNEGCWFENLEVCRNVCEFGLTGISATAGSPMIGDVDGIIMRHVRFNHNTIWGRPGVGETNTGISAMGGIVNYYSCSCHNCGIEDVEIIGNRITQCERGIVLNGGNSMIDADAGSELAGNYVSDVVITDNTMTDVMHAFILMGVWLEGRRYDWNWGWSHTFQVWLPHPDDNSRTTMIARNNYLRNVRCENNRINGYNRIVWAAGAAGRGHGLVSDNRVSDNIIFRQNSCQNGENHLAVADVLLEDWVKDGGGNKVEMALMNI